MKIGVPRDSNGDIGLSAGILFNPNFIISTSTTGTITASDVAWRNQFQDKEQVVLLLPHTTGAYGNVLAPNSLASYDQTPYGDIFVADSLDVAPSGTSFISTYRLFTLQDATLTLERTIQLAESRDKKSATAPLTNSEIMIWTDLVESDNLAGARGFINSYMAAGTVKTTLLAATAVSGLPNDYQIYINQYRTKLQIYRSSLVDYINFGLSTIADDAQMAGVEFFCKYWRSYFNRDLVALGAGAFATANIPALITRAKELLQLHKDGGFKYLRTNLNTTNGLIGLGTASGSLTAFGQQVKEYKDSQ